MNTAIRSHRYLTKLFKAFAILPLRDIEFALCEELPKYFAVGDWYGCWKFLDQAKSYLEKSTLDSNRHQLVHAFLERETLYIEDMIRYPECRFILHAADLMELKIRLFKLLNGEDSTQQAHDWVFEDYAINPRSRSPKQIEQTARLTPDSDTKGRIEVLKTCITIITDWRKKSGFHGAPRKEEGKVIAVDYEARPKRMLPSPIGVDAWKPYSLLPLPGSFAAQIRSPFDPKVSAPVKDKDLSPVSPKLGRPKGSRSSGEVLLSDCLVFPFTSAILIDLAKQIGLANKKGKYHLGGRKLGAVVGFCQALKQTGRLNKAIAVPELTRVVGELLEVELKTRRGDTDVARSYYKQTIQRLDLY